MRLFTAVLLPTDLRRDTAEAASRLLRDIPDVRRVDEENLHVTVRFLGEVDEQQVREIEAVLRIAAATVSAARAELLPEWGAFPRPERPRILFRPVHDPERTVTALEAAVTSALDPLGFAPEKRGFTPHVTVARLRSPRAGRRVAEVLAAAAESPTTYTDTENLRADTESFRVNELALVESVLSLAGPPRYSVRARYPLQTPTQKTHE